MFHKGQICRLCHDTGFNEETGQKCHCEEGDSAFVIDASIYDIVMELEEEDLDEDQLALEEYFPPRIEGKYLVFRMCYSDDHWDYMTQQEFIDAGGDSKQLKELRHGTVSMLWLPGHDCPHCELDRRNDELEMGYMLDWGWEPTRQEEAEIPVS